MNIKKKLSWLRQNKTPRHILEVELNYNQNDLRKVLATSNELRIIRNTVLGVVYKNYKQMIRTKRYKNLILSLKNNKDNIKSLNKDSKTYKKDLKNLEQEVKNIYTYRTGRCAYGYKELRIRLGYDPDTGLETSI